MSGAGPGHNRGPTLEGGTGWRRHCWTAARTALLPHLPIEVLRGRLRRAAELGLDYRTYAGIRATTGHDVVAVLFSSNALRAQAGVVPADRRDRMAAVAGAERIGLAIRPLAAPALLRLADGALDRAEPAPALWAPWGVARRDIRAILTPVPADRAILVGSSPPEADWASAAGLAAFVPDDRYFPAG